MYLLNFLENWKNEKLDLQKMTKKCIMLLALGISFEVQTLSLIIKMNGIMMNEKGIEMKVEGFVKFGQIWSTSEVMVKVTIG